MSKPLDIMSNYLDHIEWERAQRSLIEDYADAIELFQKELDVKLFASKNDARAYAEDLTADALLQGTLVIRSLIRIGNRRKHLSINPKGET